MGRKFKAQTLIAAAMLSTSAYGQSRFTGQELLTACEHGERRNSGAYNAAQSMFCVGYLRGLVEGVFAADIFHEQKRVYFCVPDHVSMDQLVRVVAKSLRDNPSTLHNHAVVEAATALRSAFPCTP